MKLCHRIFRGAFASLFLSLLTAALAAPSTSSGLIAEGTRWETPYHVVDTGVEGPTLLLVGGVHGNEPSGARSAKQIRHWPIVKGKLVVLPQANIPGLARNTRFLPGKSKPLRDLNRNFPREGETETTRGELAAAIWKLATEIEPDWVLDLHEGYEFNISHDPPEGKKKSVGSSVIYVEGKDMNPYARRALAAANALVELEDRRFVPLRRGPVPGSLARASITELGARGMILETTYNHQPLSTRTRQHRAMVNSIFRDLGMIDRDCTHILGPSASGKTISVGFFDGPGTGGSLQNVVGIIDETPNMELHHLGGPEMNPSVLDRLDVVIFPGGSGSKEAAAIGESGRESIRKFIHKGGGYLGICAGAYLCSSHYSWSLNLIDSSVFTGSREIEGLGKKQMWYRGESTDIEMQLTEAGKEIFAGIPEEFLVRYHNGPVISPKGNPDLEAYTPLAHFRSETSLYEPQKGTMIDTPAIVSGTFGRGRVISISPHPESTEALHPIIRNSVRWVAGAD